MDYPAVEPRRWRRARDPHWQMDVERPLVLPDRWTIYWVMLTNLGRPGVSSRRLPLLLPSARL
jgi:hypothetical protein